MNKKILILTSCLVSGFLGFVLSPIIVDSSFFSFFLDKIIGSGHGLSGVVYDALVHIITYIVFIVLCGLLGFKLTKIIIKNH